MYTVNNLGKLLLHLFVCFSCFRSDDSEPDEGMVSQETSKHSVSLLFLSIHVHVHTAAKYDSWTYKVSKDL